MWGRVLTIINHAKFQLDRFRGFGAPGGRKSLCSIDWRYRSYNSVRTNVLHCDGRPQAWTRRALALTWKCCKVFLCISLLSKVLVDQVFMHYFQNVSSTSGLFFHRPKPGLRPWIPLGNFRFSDPIICLLLDPRLYLYLFKKIMSVITRI